MQGLGGSNVENKEKVSELLDRSNYQALSSELSDFIKEYIQKRNDNL